MTEAVLEIIKPDISHIITEDDEPVDNLPSEKGQRLLVEPLYSSGELEAPFLVAANVGIFGAVNQPPLVPDVFVSLGVEVAEDWWAHEHRSYFFWEFGKPPDVVIEIVSNKKGGEATTKLRSYARLGIPYYAIFDPQHFVQDETLAVYERHVRQYTKRPDFLMTEVGLGLTLWTGVYEGKQDRWLRWTDLNGTILPTGAEMAEDERQRADQAIQTANAERERAEQEHARAEQEHERAERLAAKLRALGVEVDE